MSRRVKWLTIVVRMAAVVLAIPFVFMGWMGQWKYPHLGTISIVTSIVLLVVTATVIRDWRRLRCEWNK
jgi:hypothetical protein